MAPNRNPVRIYISRAGNSEKLRIRDNRNNPNLTDTKPADVETEVAAGEKIIWERDPDSLGTPKPGFFPIESLELIEETFQQPGSVEYRGSVPVLDAPPVKQADGTITADVLTKSPGPGKFANYKIVYTLTPGGPKLVDDPKLLLNS